MIELAYGLYRRDTSVTLQMKDKIDTTVIRVQKDSILQNSILKKVRKVEERNKNLKKDPQSGQK